METIYFLIALAMTIQGKMYLDTLYEFHLLLNSGIKALIAKNSNELLQYHNNQSMLGCAYTTTVVAGQNFYADSVVGVKNLVIYELDGTDIKYGVTTKSIAIGGYTLRGICQTDTGWMTYYTGATYRFVLYDATFTVVTTWDLTAPIGTISLSSWSLFAYDGTNVYFRTYSANGWSITKLALASSIVTQEPFESFIFYGTTKYKLYDHIAKSATQTYYFDELFFVLKFQLVPTCAMFDGTYFYLKEDIYGNKTIIAKKVA